MIAGAIAALLLSAAASPDPLDEARSAFAQADYVRAEELALAAAAPPREGAGLYLAALARFRSGRPAEALTLLDRAARSADAPRGGQWQFNRAACLDELGRHRDAEEAYVASAALDRELAPLALVNAGYAALDGGALERARAHAEKARASATPAALELVAELDARIAATEVERRSGNGAAAELPRRRWAALLRAEGGWDSNPLYAGEFADQRLGGAGGQPGSAVGAIDAGLTSRFAVREDLRLELAYGFSQLAFEAAGARDLSVQQHGVSLGITFAPREHLRLGAAAEGGMAFTGLSAFRGMQLSGGGRLSAALDETATTTTRADAGLAQKRGIASEFDYLGGTRVDAGVSQELQLDRGSLAAGYRFTRDAVGRASLDTSCGVGCTLTSIVPVGYAGQTLFVSGRLRLGRSLELEAIGGVEWRDYLEDDRAIRTVSGVATALASMRRHDLRWFTGEALTWHVSRAVSFLARYELVVNTSNITGASTVMGGHDGHMGAASVLGDHGYDKQAITIGTAIRW